MASGDGALIRVAETDDLQAPERLVGHSGEVARDCLHWHKLEAGELCGEQLSAALGKEAALRHCFSPPDTRGMGTADRELVLAADQRFCAVNGELWSLPGGDRVRRYPGVFLGFSPRGEGCVGRESDGELRVWKCAESGTKAISQRFSPSSRFAAEPSSHEAFA